MPLPGCFLTFHLIGAVINHQYNVYVDLISRASDLMGSGPSRSSRFLNAGRRTHKFIRICNCLSQLQSRSDLGQMLRSKTSDGAASHKFAIRPFSNSRIENLARHRIRSLKVSPETSDLSATFHRRRARGQAAAATGPIDDVVGSHLAEEDSAHPLQLPRFNPGRDEVIEPGADPGLGSSIGRGPLLRR
jgi:hypothetical protein